MIGQFTQLIRERRRCARQIRELAKRGFVTEFPDEGGVQVLLPPLRETLVLSERGTDFARKVIAFSERPAHEVLLRKIVYVLYERGILARDQFIIDIGAWLGDNAIVWSGFLSDDARVIAIDPAEENLSFGRRLCELNGISNIDWCRHVCSDRVGQVLKFEESIDHTAFREDGPGNGGSAISSTIDQVIEEVTHSRIGLFHIDVEGLEEAVLKGSDSVIAQSRPVVLFEQHISTDSMAGIVHFFESRGYRLYMINEVPKDCNLDCRNFLALPPDKELLSSDFYNLARQTVRKVHEAVPGPSLVPALAASPGLVT